MYPSFLITDNEIKYPEDIWRNYDFNGIRIAYKKEFEAKIIFLEFKKDVVFAHVNPAIEKKLLSFTQNGFSEIEIRNLQKDIHWGFICIVNKLNRNVRIVNDLFGIYPLYLINNAGGFSVSNDFDLLMGQLESAEINIHGIYDYLFFNYTLNGNTLISEISQITGGSCFLAAGSLVTVSIEHDIAKTIITGIKTKINKDELLRLLKEHVNSDLDARKPVYIPLSGGFDSKVILSLLLSEVKDFSAFTFGARGSTDHKAAELMARHFNLDYQLLETNKEFITQAETYIKDFIDYSSGMPLILDLLSYALVKEKIPSSNLVTGVMGGELIAGPVIISEVIITRFAKLLIESETGNQFESALLKNIDDFPILDKKYFEEKSEEYSNSLSGYFFNKRDKQRINLVNFLLKETYGKFFGVIFRNLFHKFNVINPFTDREFLKALLNTNRRFTRIPPFSKNPVSHYFSKRIIPEMVKRAYKPVLKMPMDRGYKLADAYYIHRLPNVLWFYIKNKILKGNKAEHYKTINYTKWLNELVHERLKGSPVLNWPVFNNDFINESLNKSTNEPDFILRKMILILSLHYFNKKYEEKISFKR